MFTIDPAGHCGFMLSLTVTVAPVYYTVRRYKDTQDVFGPKDLFRLVSIGSSYEVITQMLKKISVNKCCKLLFKGVEFIHGVPQ